MPHRVKVRRIWHLVLFLIKKEVLGIGNALVDGSESVLSEA